MAGLTKDTERAAIQPAARPPVASIYDDASFRVRVSAVVCEHIAGRDTDAPLKRLAAYIDARPPVAAAPLSANEIDDMAFGYCPSGKIGELREFAAALLAHRAPDAEANRRAAPAAPVAGGEAVERGVAVEWPNGSVDVLLISPKPEALDHWKKSGAVVNKVFIGTSPTGQDTPKAAWDAAKEMAARRVEADCTGFKEDDAQLDSIIEHIRAMPYVPPPTLALSAKAAECSGCDPAEGFCRVCREAEKRAPQQDEKAGQVPCRECWDGAACAEHDSPAAPEGKTEASEIPTWQERAAKLEHTPTAEEAYNLLQGEIDDLRAALAARPPVAAPDRATATLQFLTDVVTAAGLLSHGKTDKGLANRISADAYAMRAAIFANSSAVPAPNAEAIRSAALEEAAKTCEYLIEQHGIHSNFICANAIRALSAGETKGGEA